MVEAKIGPMRSIHDEVRHPVTADPIWEQEHCKIQCFFLFFVVELMKLKRNNGQATSKSSEQQQQEASSSSHMKQGAHEE